MLEVRKCVKESLELPFIRKINLGKLESGNFKCPEDTQACYWAGGISHKVQFKGFERYEERDCRVCLLCGYPRLITINDELLHEHGQGRAWRFYGLDEPGPAERKTRNGHRREKVVSSAKEPQFGDETTRSKSRAFISKIVND